MAVSDYLITPKDLAKTCRRLGWRFALGLLFGATVAFGIGYALNLETGFFVGLLTIWIIAQWDGRWLFGLAITLLMGIMAASILDVTIELGDSPIVERFAIWVFYLLSIGVVKLGIDLLAPKKPPKPASPPFVHPLTQTHSPLTPKQQKPESLPHAPKNKIRSGTKKRVVQL